MVFCSKMSCKGFVNIIPIIRTSVITFSKFSSNGYFNSLKTFNVVRLNIVPASNIHSSCVRLDLMEFFDDKKNWGKSEIKVGRSWRKEDLRIKSNSDLHKLWFVLLKERNMLLTMEEEYNRVVEIFANPERLDKVKESMHNLEEVIMERNRAYHQLETGETGERPCKVATNLFGLKYFHRMTEHLIPKHLNKQWRNTRMQSLKPKETNLFLSLYREKMFVQKLKERRRQQRHVFGLLRTFPNLDIQYLKELYPNMDIDKMKSSKKVTGTGEQFL